MTKWSKWVRRRPAVERNVEPYSPDLVRVGDVIQFWTRRPDHYATIYITKVNENRFEGVEIDGEIPCDRTPVIGKRWQINRLATHLRRPVNALDLLAKLEKNRK